MGDVENLTRKNSLPGYDGVDIRDVRHKQMFVREGRTELGFRSVIGGVEDQERTAQEEVSREEEGKGGEQEAAEEDQSRSRRTIRKRGPSTK